MFWKPYKPEVAEPKKTFFIVTIAYKSGIKFTGRFSKFSWKKDATCTSYEWVSAINKQYPDKPLNMGVDDIETIWYHEEL